MFLFHVFSTTVVVYVACTQVVAEDSVTLSADAQHIPGGYVVPERGNVIFNCSHSSNGALFWTVDLRIPDGTAIFTPSVGLAIPNVTSPDTMPNTSPASLTIHYIAPESNGSSVECSDGNLVSSSNATIIVEGYPNCPIIQTSSTSEDSFVVLVQQSHITWLPVSYHVEVTSYNMSIVTAHNSSLSSDGSVEVTSLQPGTVYNISVTPCNMAGCNRSCDIHSANTIPIGGVIVQGGGGGAGDPLQSSLIIGLSIVAMAVLVLAVAIVLILVLCFYRRRRDKQKKGGAEQRRIENKSTNMTEYAEIVRNTLSTKGNSLQLQGPAQHTTFTRAPGASAVEYSIVQDAFSISRLQSKQTSTLPPVSPPPPPCPPRHATMHIDADKVQDAGYATVPHSQGSKRFTKVRSTLQNANQKPANSANSPNNRIKV